MREKNNTTALENKLQIHDISEHEKKTKTNNGEVWECYIVSTIQIHSEFWVLHCLLTKLFFFLTRVPTLVDVQKYLQKPPKIFF